MTFYTFTQGKLDYFSDEESTIDCQSCGTVLRVLSNAEAQEVSYNPYNYIFFCTPCRKYEEDRMIAEYDF